MPSRLILFFLFSFYSVIFSSPQKDLLDHVDLETKGLKYNKKALIESLLKIEKDGGKELYCIHYIPGHGFIINGKKGEYLRRQLNTFIGYNSKKLTKPFSFIAADEGGYPEKIRKLNVLGEIPFLNHERLEQAEDSKHVFLLPPSYDLSDEKQNVIRQAALKFPFSEKKSIALFRGAQTGGTYN